MDNITYIHAPQHKNSKLGTEKKREKVERYAII